MWEDSGHCNADSKHLVWKSLRSIYREGLLPLRYRRMCFPLFLTLQSSITDALSKTLKEKHLKAILDGILRIHQSFVQYHQGEEEQLWNDTRRRLEVTTNHKLRHLGSSLMSIASHLNLRVPDTLYCHESQSFTSSDFMPLDEVAGNICVVDSLIACALSESVALGKSSHGEVAAMNAAWQQYHSFLKFASNIMSTLLLIFAMKSEAHKHKRPSELNMDWKMISESCKSRFEQFLGFVKSSFAHRNGRLPTDCRPQVEEVIQFLLQVCSLGWDREIPREETNSQANAIRMVRLQALKAGGEESDFMRFIAKDSNLESVKLDLVKDLISKKCLKPALNMIFALAVPVNFFSENNKKCSRNWMSSLQFNDVWSKIWNADQNYGVTFALRSAIGDRLLFKPNMEKMDPVFSLRCELLRKTITEVCKRTSEFEFAYWQKLCSSSCDFSRHDDVLPRGVSIQDIRRKAQDFLNKAGLTDFEDGSNVFDELQKHLEDFNSSMGKLWVIEVCILAFARLHGRNDVNPNLCDEAERMAASLHSQGNALALISLLCALSPKKYQASKTTFYRRRMILSDVLNLAEAKDQQVRTQLPPSLNEEWTPFLEALTWIGPGGQDAGMGDDVFYGSSTWKINEGEGVVMLTKALDEHTRDELVQDDFKGVASSVLSLARFCVRQAREGDSDSSIQHARHIITKLKEMKDSRSPAFNQIKHNQRFWSVMLRIVPVALRQEQDELAETLILWCFKHSPSASSCVAFLHESSEEKIQFVHKLIQSKDSHSKEYPLLFGCSALLESRATAEEQLKSACRRLSLKQIVSELKSLILILGPQAFKTSQPESEGDVQSSPLGRYLRILSDHFKSSKFLEVEHHVLELLKVGAMVEPGCIQSMLEKQVNDVCMKVHRALDSGKSGPRDLKEGFASWLSRLKEVFHTRPAVVNDAVHDLWGRASRRFSPVPRDSAGASDLEAVKPSKSSIRIRGPSLSSEWDQVVGIIKVLLHAPADYDLYCRSKLARRRTFLGM
eukprot:753676-Hanusia_phi.AAC.16